MKLIKSMVLFVVLVAAKSFAADVSYNGFRPDFVIDVRTPAEYVAGHIDGAINIPVERIGQDLRAVKGVRQDSTILLYCRSGRRSAIAAEVIRQQGYQRVLDGGGIDTLVRSLKQCQSNQC
ncbi:rhodanese-like domain-containing protein [Propionivibrio dicarboxylicus]|uniref:Rhodanese-like domain-containing protein n=1 Tax=Propionivibrio dicarboxylicus TaxID=83767 RepID=A0A1G8EZP8_9RHOO|nr:rhodanese-like domain-containing protein [Propionivibrio dicarboxylicus]SDH75239.1 Rhodanese-like domain-containing protein [Propionivibrio dicarboxylicus]